MQKFIIISLLFFSIWFLEASTTPEKISVPEIPKPADTAQTTGTTTEPVLSLAATTSLETNAEQIIEEVTSTTTIEKVIVKKPEPEKIPVSPAIPPEPAPDFAVINTFARTAVVNILCSTKGGELSPISGTGVIISSKGIILTNAHIGQYFLLRNFRQKDFVECVIRTGSPAYPRYHAELVYISPIWVANNKTLLKQTNPKGTGENDFAFLRITDNIDKSLNPLVFSYIPTNTREVIDKGKYVVLVSYPAGFLGGLSILQGLSVTSAVTAIQDFFTFKDNTIDVISVPGTVVSQKGASGGAVVDKNSTLIGIISTSSDGNATKDRDLRAITLSYIDRDLQNELGINLSSFLSQDLTEFAKIFASTTAPKLTKIITDELNK